jgi:hypothetical protein
MIEGAHAALAGWDSFYVIVGSSAAALIGLQFVVIALLKDTRSLVNVGAISAFGTPTVMHLAGALLISAIMSAPWPSLFAVAGALTASGLAGVAYGGSVIYHARTQTGYAPVWEDWLWHVILPCAAYAAVTIAALSLLAYTSNALFAIAAAALGLLFIAIHNAWDTVTFIVAGQHTETPAPGASKQEPKRSKRKPDARRGR